MKRVIILSDLHSGHRIGLTPRGWQNREWLHTSKQLAQIYAIQKACWDAYERELKQHGPFDVVVLNGDMIDGRGERSGGTELITTNVDEQCDMAVACVRKAITKRKTKVYMTYGTGYHTGNAEDWENKIAGDLDAENVEPFLNLNIEGVGFNFKHHIGTSSVPYGRHTAVARERSWEIEKYVREVLNKNGNAQLPSVIIRSHVHYFKYCGDEHFFGCTTPALEAPGTKFGARRCSGTVSWGFLWFECNKGEFIWRAVTPAVKGLESFTVKA